MVQKTASLLEKSRKIKLLKPLLGKHSLHGQIKVIGFIPTALLCEGFFQEKNVTKETALLEIKTSSGEVFCFEGETLLGSEGAFSFQGTKQKFLQDLHRLVSQVRKNQHIEICQYRDVEAKERYTGFRELSFMPQALPDLDESELNTKVKFLGKEFSYPLLITGMTGGVDEGHRLNKNLAKAASSFNIPMGVGSQRIALEHPQYEKIFTLKNDFSDLFLLGNLGFSDLLLEQDPVDYCKRAVDMIAADALAIHLNLIQECVQIEGNRQFKGFLKLIEKISSSLSVPLTIKEVGCGIHPSLAKKLQDSGVKAIDVGGLGGTSWSQVESYRADSSYKSLGECFRDWGIPTAFSLLTVKEACPDLDITATGGIRDGQTVAKACALGASLSGLGLPLFKAALVSADEVMLALDIIARQLNVTMLGTGSQDLSKLANSLVKGRPLEQEFHELFDKNFNK